MATNPTFTLKAEARYYVRLAYFRMREPFTDFRATGITYLLYCFFIWLLSRVWLKFNGGTSDFTYAEVFFYIGVTEMLFMSFLNARLITTGSEDFSLFLARPRSWMGRELAANIGSALGRRLLFCASLATLALLLQLAPEGLPGVAGRIAILLAVLAIPQALIATLFSALRLSFPQTDYFILPFGKLFLSLGGVFGPLSDYGEPWRSLFLNLPGSDLFFQPAYFAVHGHFYRTNAVDWALRQVLIDSVLFALLWIFYRRGRRNFQAWGG